MKFGELEPTDDTDMVTRSLCVSATRHGAANGQRQERCLGHGQRRAMASTNAHRWHTDPAPTRLPDTSCGTTTRVTNRRSSHARFRFPGTPLRPCRKESFAQFKFIWVNRGRLPAERDIRTCPAAAAVQPCPTIAVTLGKNPKAACALQRFLEMHSGNSLGVAQDTPLCACGAGCVSTLPPAVQPEGAFRAGPRARARVAC